MFKKIFCLFALAACASTGCYADEPQPEQTSQILLAQDDENSNPENQLAGCGCGKKKSFVNSDELPQEGNLLASNDDEQVQPEQLACSKCKKLVLAHHGEDEEHINPEGQLAAGGDSDNEDESLKLVRCKNGKCPLAGNGGDDENIEPQPYLVA